MSLALTDSLDGSIPLEGTLAQAVPCAAFPRLAELVLDASARLRIDIEAGRSPSGVPLVAGEVRGRVEQQCQRCLEPVATELAVAFRLAVVDSGSEDLAPPDFEPWQADESGATLREMIEDELLLALPMVARHEAGRCGTLAERLQERAQDTGDSVPPERNNPFAVLRQLKKE